MIKRFVIPMTVEFLEKARKSPRLVPVKKLVTREGRTFQTTVWVLPEDVKAGKTGGAQGSLFDDVGPAPVIQGDLFDRVPDDPKPEQNEGLSRMIARETKEIESNGGKVYPIEISGKKYFIELEGSFGWKNRGQDAIVRNEKWEVVKTKQNPHDKTKTALIEWAKKTVEGSDQESKPQDVSGIRLADGDYPKDILRDGEKIGKLTEARVNGKVVGYNVRNLQYTLVGSAKTPEEALAQFKNGIKKEEPTEPDAPKPEEFTFEANGDTKTARITLEDRPTISGKTKQVKVISVYGSKDKETPEWTKQVEKDEPVARSWVEHLHKKYGKNESGGAAKESAESESKNPDEALPVGSTKTENGVTYRLNENHRWEKVEQEESGKEKLMALIERAGGKAKLKEMLLGARKAEREGQGSMIDLSNSEIINRTTEKVIDGLVNASGLSRSEVLKEIGIKEGKAKLGVPKKGEKKKADSGDELDPNSENYKFKDTGYIAGSRKELAAERIKEMLEKGQLVRRTDIPWEDLEKNPRKAQTLITKSNLFGVVPWDKLKERGMEPGAGFLVDRIYASIAKEPEDNAASRKDYVYGLESLRDRLEKCDTVNDVINVLKEIKGEIDGEVYSAREAEEYQVALSEVNALMKIKRDYEEKRDALSKEANNVSYAISGLKYEQQKRERRGWKPDPEVAKKLADLEKDREKKLAAYDAFVESHPEMKEETVKHGTWDTGMTYEYRGEFLDKYNAARKKLADVRKAVVERNLLENDTTRAWIALGSRFNGVINYRSYKGSDAFGNHIANARAGRIKDWSWMKTERNPVEKGATKESVRFQLKVAESFERKGGRKVDIGSTLDFKNMFNLRDVQSGNWVLKDVNSAKFHTEHAAEAFADMADVLGIPDNQVSLNGRLAMAFGARGSGSSGWKKGAAKAHYEHVERVINITKNGGGGSLGHEWFHAFDNMLKETMSGESTGKDIMLTEDPSQVSDPDVRKAFEGIRSAMLDGSVIPPKKISYTNKDYRNAEYGFKRDYGRYGDIKKTGSAQKAVEYLYSLYEKYDVENPSKYDKKALKQRDDWVRTAVAWFDKKEGGGSITVNIGRPVSSFLMGAMELDEGKSKDYWSNPRELAARAFQSYLEDRLADKGQKNDYLSVYADNKYHKDPMFGIEWKPYPEGEERTRINSAFDKLFEVVRSKNLIQKAIDKENARMVKSIRLWRFS